VKGTYGKARRGEIKGFTGIDDPYETPVNPEVTLDTVAYTSTSNARFLLQYLIEQGFVREQAPSLSTNRKGWDNGAKVW
jgi:sulfate adenylyltransferase